MSRRSCNGGIGATTSSAVPVSSVALSSDGAGGNLYDLTATLTNAEFASFTYQWSHDGHTFWLDLDTDGPTAGPVIREYDISEFDDPGASIFFRVSCTDVPVPGQDCLSNVVGPFIIV